MRQSIKKRCVRQAGFTITELLVVIGIIAIISAILLPVVNSAIAKADVAKARQDINDIVAAIKGYYAEYGVMPWPDRYNEPNPTFGGKSLGAGQHPQRAIIGILSDHDDYATNNARRIQFLEVPPSSRVGVDADGNGYAATDGYFLDPWENPYVIALDTDASNIVTFVGLKTPPAPVATWVLDGRTVCVLSYGPDMADTNRILKSW